MRVSPSGLSRMDDVSLGDERTRRVRCRFRLPVCCVVLGNEGRLVVPGYQLERLRTTVRADKASATKAASGRAIATTSPLIKEKVEPENCWRLAE